MELYFFKIFDPKVYGGEPINIIRDSVIYR